MSKLTKHILLPLTVSALFFLVAALPFELLGCRNRGLVAALLAIAAGAFAIAAAVKALVGKARGDAHSYLWMASAVLLSIPSIYLVLTET